MAGQLIAPGKSPGIRGKIPEELSIGELTPGKSSPLSPPQENRGIVPMCYGLFLKTISGHCFHSAPPENTGKVV